MPKNFKCSINLAIVLFLILVSVLYIAIMAELPISLNPLAGKDDGLYIGLGHAIAEGHWLGGYSSTTHAKGIGYPVFLAINHWTGLSINVGHAIFHILVNFIFAYAIFRTTGSVILVAITFCVVLLNPTMYSADMARVSRDIIYAYQTFLIVGLIILAMHAKSKLNRGLIALLVGGLWVGFG